LLLPVLLLNIHYGYAQEEDPRPYLIEKLRFYYVEAPNDSSQKPFLLDNEKIAANDTSGHYGEFWTSLNTEIARALVRGLLGTPENGGDLALQRYAKEICQIQDKPVEVWLYIDADSLNAFAMDTYHPCLDSEGYVWPCASSFKKGSEKFEEWAGYMHLGTINMNTHRDEWTKAAFLHELMHTQDHSNVGAHIFHSYEAGKWFDYGSDGTHYMAEAVPSLISAYQEGIANTVGMLYDEKEARQIFTWFANNDYLLVETTYDSTAAVDLPARAWLYHRIRQAINDDGDDLSGEDRDSVIVANYRGYRIRELPPKFIIHNEMIIALIFSKYVQHVNLDTFIEAVIATNFTDPSMSPLAQMFKSLCEAGLPAGETVLTARKLPVATPKPYLLPLAYADYLTGYTAMNKQEFSEIFEEELPQPWIDLYWDTEMQHVREVVPLDDRTSYEDLNSIARTLDIYLAGTP
jgi:hypothetical protein